MELVNVTRLVDKIEASKLEFEYLMRRYVECLERLQTAEKRRNDIV